MTGTPIMDDIKEVDPFFKFLAVKGTGSLKTFKQNFCSDTDPDHPRRLSEMLRNIMLRRTHQSRILGAPILKLPSNKSETVYLEMTPLERRVVTEIVDYYKMQFSNDGDKATGSQAAIERIQAVYPQHALKTNGGARYGDCPPNMGRYTQLLAKQKKRRKVQKKKLSCMYCDLDAINPKSSDCEHIFCEECAQSLLDADVDSARVVCPECNTEISTFASVDPSSGSSPSLPPSEKFFELPGLLMPSTKTLEVKNRILKWKSENTRCKIIIFTQFQETVDLMCQICKIDGWQAYQYYGKQSKAAKNKVTQEFNAFNGMCILVATV
ncbi:hypothetical protein EJ08DRAFT_683563 [Tothia fuscella]|uniref:RING-type domain-containing protein n=1 Tax=Tothia fuscella TaxID=1048955 RepID=A0A9P4NFU0_9PEZI|nr:hypothetical protein EJ08DRAFT_683563 [Tothia fuscella]